MCYDEITETCGVTLGIITTAVRDAEQSKKNYVKMCFLQPSPAFKLPP